MFVSDSLDIHHHAIIVFIQQDNDIFNRSVCYEVAAERE